MNITTLSNQTFIEIGSPSGTTPLSYVSGWYLYNLGTLNNLITSSYSGVSGDFSPELGDEEGMVYKEAFKLEYYDRLASQSLCANSVDWVSIQEGDSVIRRASSNDKAKTYISLRDKSNLKLNLMINLYRSNVSIPSVIKDNGDISESDLGGYVNYTLSVGIVELGRN